MFIGSIEDLKDVDRTLYESLKRRDTKYFAATRLSDESGASVGVFGIT